MSADEQFSVNTRVWLHLMCLGVTPEEIEHLSGLVKRIEKTRRSVMPKGLWSGNYLCVYMRHTARATKRSPLFGLKRLKSKRKPNMHQAATLVYQIPNSCSVSSTFDPWNRLWDVKQVDLNADPY